ncbi:MAG: CDP-alcohol phosphatidyltransferase family protein, partial [Spartobacteria bacterium]
MKDRQSQSHPLDFCGMENVRPILLADSPDCLTELCGITLIERLLRTLQRLGFTRATVVTSNNDIAAEVTKRSWPRAKVIVDLAERIPETAQPLLIVPANVYCDARLLRALCAKTNSAELRDFPSGPRLQTGDNSDIRREQRIDIVDPAEVDDYIVSMRRHVRPVCIFPALDIAQAERMVLDSAQNGTLDLPAQIHAPIETWLVSHLCRTPITPNQITIFTAFLSAMVVFQFATGRLWSGTLLALVIGILDGIDGKLARVKVETTELGQWEHKIDAVLEAAWWLALALHFRTTSELPSALLLFGALLLADVADGFARRSVRRATGRNLDDVSNFDRAFRLVSGRRNIYVWMFASGLLFGVAPQTY